MVARAFVLIDALPNRKHDVYQALDRFPGIIAKRELTQRVGQGDVIALVEGKDGAELETILTSRLRSVPFVHNLIRVTAHATLLGPVRALMDEMAREADAKKKA